MTSLEWRRYGATRRAHAYVDGRPCCAKAQSGSVPVVMHPVVEFVPWTGLPWGQVCSICLSFARAFVMSGRKPRSKWRPDDRPLWQRALEARRA